MPHLSPVHALLFGSAVLAGGNGLQTVLLPLRAGLEGFSTPSIGLIGAAHNVGLAAGCALVPALVRRLGHVKGFAALAAVAAVVAMAYALTDLSAAWVALRLVTGFCMAGLAMVVESWINANASNGSRGSVLAGFAIAAAAAATGGQMLIALADPGGFLLFGGIAMMLLLAALPLAMAERSPAGRDSVRLSLKRLYAVSPVGVLGCFFIGLANGAFWQLAPVYAHGRDLSTSGVALFMSIVVAAGALAQWPLGWLSDRVDRRKVIVGALLAAIGADLLMAAPSASTGMTLAAVAVFGACVLPIYSLCVAHTNDVLGRQHCVAASGGLLLAFGLGAIVGPLVASAAMQAFGAGALFVHAALVHVAFVVFALHRIRMRRRPTPVARPTALAGMRSVVFAPRARDGAPAAKAAA